LNPGHRLSDICMILIGNLSLFSGEIVLSDCSLIHMPLIHTMFVTFE
jgi:hypothetical protein